MAAAKVRSSKSTAPELKSYKGRKPVIVAEDVTKQFTVGREPYQVLCGVSLTIFEGEFIIMYGPSGSGKSTFLNTIIGLEPPTSGKIFIDGIEIDSLSDDERAELRVKRIGLVSQAPIWVKALSVLENIAMPLLIANASDHVAFTKATEKLAEIDLLNWAKHKPTELSGGQQQRVNLARALVNDPRIIFLDEPTGNLDSHSAEQVLNLLMKLNKEERRTLIMVTHNLEYLPLADRTVMIRDGKVEKITVKADLKKNSHAS